jgi:hypothetical protein
MVTECSLSPPGILTIDSKKRDFSTTTGAQRLLAWWRALIVCSREGP